MKEESDKSLRPAKQIRISQDEGNKYEGACLTIMVGPGTSRYTAHEKMARASSPYIDKLLRERTTRIIDLPGEEPAMVAMYVHWLYHRTLPVICDQAQQEYLHLIKAYVLGLKLLDTQFQDTVVDAIVEQRQSSSQDGKSPAPSREAIKYAYSHTSSSAPIRRLLVDITANRTTDPKWLTSTENDMPRAFLLELVAKLMCRRATKKEPLDPSVYHKHARVSNNASQAEDDLGLQDQSGISQRDFSGSRFGIFARKRNLDHIISANRGLV
ncbi:uncharacterized protein BO66DRAFT_472926 [Aspergillus aculeatinus CBS 121060]|uniref:Uncharacterized protein n=1 Tax=Aspergillus aculeatinus CBS 121060 TaxID=1448322 RepID=A0ACD1H379_9EURO|nr:hypothetical protein BO66DRAFT_472926 [Aspergillus aculeatinus CBS 121060]RAH68066.1 hypothetical protein BO66DRAFT_472926 [Aspergillus aculeatinus CBS 121060]